MGQNWDEIAYLKNNNTTSFVAGRQKVSIVIKFYTRDNVGIRDIIIQSAFDLWKTPTGLAT